MPFIDFKPSMFKALNLGPGGVGALPPTGWETMSFDDSAWDQAAAPALTEETLFNATQIPPTIYTDTIPADGPEPIWSTTTMQAPNQWSVFRGHFDLPGAYTINDIAFWQAEVDGAPFGTIFEKQIYINGQSDGGNFTGIRASNMNSMMHSIGVPGDNLIAIFIWEHNGADIWTDAAWWTVRIDLTEIAVGRSYAQIIG
jgi:hypothetical protein